MTLILDNSDSIEVNTYTWEKEKVHFRHVKPDAHGCVEISMHDFCEMALYVLTNTDLAKEDPRIRFVEMVKKLERTEGFNGGRTSRFAEKEAK